MSIQLSQSSFIHPILFAFFPAIFLFSTNFSFLNLDDLLYSSLLLIGVTIASWFLLKFIFKNTKKSSIVLSLSLILFFSYGHIQKALIFSGLELFLFLYDPVLGCLSLIINSNIVSTSSSDKSSK